MPIGTVILYNAMKGFGFIRSEPCNTFFHRSVIFGEPPKAGDTVRYEAIEDGRNSPRATVVRLVDAAVMAEADRVFGVAH